MGNAIFGSEDGLAPEVESCVVDLDDACRAAAAGPISGIRAPYLRLYRLQRSFQFFMRGKNETSIF